MLALLALCVLPASAQSLYKCKDAAGGIVYQSQACPGATLRSWEVAELRPAPVVAQPAQVTSNPPSARPRTVRARNLRAPRRSAAPRDDRHARCLAARAQRDTTLARLGLQRRYDDLRRLNDAVSSACNHRGIR
ncbi:DUF4124 domain-containing protein [Luteimonas sp. S4-F44]|uniref:DUF4124 domain-containing protein n=1 Tax=Luteimonas sp. S4-F44 TaxID=2925842 RepID=UPI001F53A80B|nr:DUF4124 domain-containing protein [Luteimonas sp. S4-F44]UNK44005.1 DUF4124 domain-containing protein [Luteimonas sp. S4-F44]